MQFGVLLLVLLNLWPAFVTCNESNKVDPSVYPCRGKGYRDDTTGNCMCINGYFGFDCQYKYCPHGTSWHSMPKVAHTRNSERVACSNMGDCDYTTGVCACRPGYDGRACERFACPTRQMLRINSHTTDTTGVQFSSLTNLAGDLVSVR